MNEDIILKKKDNLDESSINNEKKHRNNFKIIILFLIIIILIGIAVYFLFIKESHKKIICYKYEGENGEYYCGSTNEDDDNNYIEEVFYCKTNECDEIFDQYKIISFLYDTELYGFILSNNNKYAVYSINDEKLYQIETDISIDIILDFPYFKGLLARDYILIQNGEGGNYKHYVFNYKTNKSIYGGFFLNGEISKLDFGNDLYYLSDQDTDVIYCIFDKNMNFITENKIINTMNIKDNKLYINYYGDSTIYVYDENGKLEQKSTKKGELLYSDNGYYVSYVNNQSILFDDNDNKIISLSSEKLYITDIGKDNDIIGIEVNTGYNMCPQNNKEVGSYYYNLNSQKLTWKKIGVCREYVIEEE